MGTILNWIRKWWEGRKIIVGETYVFKMSDPFNKYYVVVMDNKEGWVKYKFTVKTKYNTAMMYETCPVYNFKRYYKRLLIDE